MSINTHSSSRYAASSAAEPRRGGVLLDPDYEHVGRVLITVSI
jgi:hypothetical protein